MMSVTVREILGPGFFCECEDQKPSYEGRFRTNPFTDYVRTVWSYRCSNCDRPICTEEEQ